MSHYTSYDFTESMDRAGVSPHDVAQVVAAYGTSVEGYGEWNGGFLLEMKEGFALLTGWCDTTGWGCQDGGNVDYFDSLEEAQRALDDDNGDLGFDLWPADLAKSLEEAKQDGRWSDAV